ncbi:reductive dehalogenase [Dehalogenimonas etheniformans]|uniref:Reductive dehalogenase n=1 Tax=Dehalogenimonas etheniformans TaxID=1536648 RepID=A0A2P5PA40_9CHLR|nr:reductive dehalogenase [Dehalogenimonas etheniformans]PPD59178.1 reductive dehalogenase [Dehalogenimonas etheniformans]QNT75780.1 reductive dehalogenase [Dehalogenimonas etheniformans]
MSKFHSIISRREFMKALGLAGAGVGAAAALAPTFHDIDELISSGSPGWKRPWWVKEKDEPTVEIDWSQIKRFDHRLTSHSNYVNAQHWGADEWKKILAEQKQYAIDSLGKKGFTVRDYALNAGGHVFRTIGSRNTFLGVLQTPTNENILGPGIGLPKWQGTPEENSKMIRAVAKTFGAAQIGCAHLGPDERKLIYTYNRTGPTGSSTGANWIDGPWPPPAGNWRKFDFEDVAVGYETPDGQRCVLPNGDLWDVSVCIQMSRPGWRTISFDPGGKSTIAADSNDARYRMFHESILPGLQTFLWGIGYHGYGYCSRVQASSKPGQLPTIIADQPGGLMPAEAGAVLSGQGEMGRSSEVTITPEFGPVSGFYSILTDLPLASSKPIDAGIFRFCHSCRKCADSCPAQAISFDAEPSWEIPRWDYKVPSLDNNPGKKLFWTDLTSCQATRGRTGCIQCRPICAFNTHDAAMIHQLVRATAATTGMFNSFFYQMSKSFDYGFVDAEDWWDIAPGLPSWGVDNTLNAWNAAD